MKAAPLPDPKTILNREGQEGWHLVQILAPDLQMSARTVQTKVPILERPLAG